MYTFDCCSNDVISKTFLMCLDNPITLNIQYKIILDTDSLEIL